MTRFLDDAGRVPARQALRFGGAFASTRAERAARLRAAERSGNEAKTRNRRASLLLNIKVTGRRLRRCPRRTAQRMRYNSLTSAADKARS